MVYGMLDDIAAQKRVSSDIKKDGTFSVSLTGLKTGTAYYYTYVGVDSLYIYGNINTFTTLDDTPTPGETVDLGLKVKWANSNVGATRPEEAGGYYAWGETEEKSDYSKADYKYYDSKNDSCTHIGDSISGTEYDVAHVKWGGAWRMPTIEDYKELYERCTWEWTTYNGVYGQLVTGPNGNSIFLPAAGYRSTTDNVTKGTAGYYWSGSLYDDGNAYFLIIDNEIWSRSYKSRQRRYGQSVRPVMGLMKL